MDSSADEVIVNFNGLLVTLSYNTSLSYCKNNEAILVFFCLAKNIVEESHKLVDSLDKLRVSAASSSSNFKKKPVIIIVVGMAGKQCS